MLAWCRHGYIFHLVGIALRITCDICGEKRKPDILVETMCKPCATHFLLDGWKDMEVDSYGFANTPNVVTLPNLDWMPRNSYSQVTGRSYKRGDGAKAGNDTSDALLSDFPLRKVNSESWLWNDKHLAYGAK